MTEEIFLSQDAFNKLQEELDFRSNKRRIELDHMIEKARELGD